MRLTEKLSDRVRNLLIQYPNTRDDDMYLLALLWNRQVGDSNKRLAVDLLCDLTGGRLSNPETVRRTRQLLQQENPDLRGKKYRKRQKHVKTFKKDVKKIKKYSSPQMEMI